MPSYAIGNLIRLRVPVTLYDEEYLEVQDADAGREFVIVGKNALPSGYTTLHVVEPDQYEPNAEYGSWLTINDLDAVQVIGKF